METEVCPVGGVVHCELPDLAALPLLLLDLGHQSLDVILQELNRIVTRAKRESPNIISVIFCRLKSER